MSSTPSPADRYKEVAVLKKIVQWSLVAFVIFYIATQPTNAAEAVKSGMGALETTANGFSQFLSETAS